ncbi:aminotransferase class I/II-fold pyridoxal phosphate-dependent enzyme [Halobacillus sp. A1]|uniref:aminotransferase class I/II-fold pyridoxal phosphate-dependent enzyme n=1 Tax=Halobacillus sp. A1 TaxID=2880262 RepID=UPI0020A67860|nr:aminotransferase class I/II-fold pyridoxal phosphate-dependent enzyme [Halobacillus sp. A1]MCP3030049.1 aminotransferase class I/II-fold pyridoxal phosphate-dependent enzyme [Halobacillus sp. A1]
MKNSRIFLSPPHMTGNEQHYIEEAFKSNWIAPVGPNIDAFEKEIAEYVGAKGAVAVSSGTAAIHLALSLLNVQRGDRVFCTSLTFVATANPIVYQGAEPVFIDSEPESWNMSPIALEKALSEAYRKRQLPKAVILVHLYGQSAKIDQIQALCDLYKVPLVEDAAESLGSLYKGQHTGTFGEFGIYSFNGNKIITTSGGGMLVSNNLEALERAKFLAAQARDKALHYQHSTTGFNYRMSNILAGVGRAQLEVIDQRVEARRRLYERYKRKLTMLTGLQFMPELQDTTTNRWLTVFTLDSEHSNVLPEQLIMKMSSQNIEARPVWKPLHLQPLFRDCQYFSHRPHEDISKELFLTGICLPSGSNLTDLEQNRVIACVQDVFEKAVNKEGII